MSIKQSTSTTGPTPSPPRVEATATTVHPIRTVTDELYSRVSRFQAELDAIVRRPVTPTECREALLDTLVRHRSLVAGAWHIVEGAVARIDAHRLQGPVFERDEIRKWLGLVA